MHFRTANLPILIISLNTQTSGSSSPFGYKWNYLAAWTMMKRCRFLGTNIMGDFSLGDLTGFVSDASRTGDFRIRDITNGKTIVEWLVVTPQAEDNAELDVAVSNLSTGPAKWEVQAKISSVTGGHYVGMSEIILKQ